MRMSSFVAVRALRSSINNGNLYWRTFSTSSSCMTKPSSTSSNEGSADLTANVTDPPSKIFKKVDSGELGPGASKTSDYKNPEYFTYHSFTYVDMDVEMQRFRNYTWKGC